METCGTGKHYTIHIKTIKGIGRATRSRVVSLIKWREMIYAAVLKFLFLMFFQMNAAGGTGLNAAGRNAVVTSLMICCGFIVCWSPNQINVIVSYLGHTVDYTTMFYHFTVVMVFMNSCINPFIYAAKYREFQTGVKRLMCK